MDELESRLMLAKRDRHELDQLIRDYLPFIKKQVSSISFSSSLETEDLLSLAMMTFASCVKQYDIQKGSFLGFAQACIHNRLVDEGRKAARHATYLLPLSSEEEALALSEAASIAHYDRERERETLCYEIDEFSSDLAPFGITFQDLTLCCPRHKRARRQCFTFAQYILHSSTLTNKLVRQHRLPQSELSETFHISLKTLEKYRKYIVALVVLLSGDYPMIQTLIPQYEEAIP